MSVNTFDGKVVVEYFRDNLKKYLKSSDANVILESEMLNAIENTLRCFHEENGLNTDKVSNISKVLFDGYAMTSVYRLKDGKPKKCLHSRNFYTEQSEIINDEKLTRLDIKQVPGDKVSKLIFDNLKTNKSDNLKLLQLLTPSEIVFRPMILAKPNERSKFKFEELPKLQEDTFDEIFDNDCLSENQVKAFKVIEAGVEGFMKEQPFTLPPEIKHPLLNNIRRMKQYSSLNSIPICGEDEDAMCAYFVGILEGENKRSRGSYYRSDSEESYYSDEEESEEENEENLRGEKMEVVRLRRDSYDYDSDSDSDVE